MTGDKYFIPKKEKFSNLSGRIFV